MGFSSTASIGMCSVGFFNGENILFFLNFILYILHFVFIWLSGKVQDPLISCELLEWNLELHYI